ncbi:hypothetical protein [Rickettsia endosymbiont of Nabis limbatus]|uniref:hypothetical protein n=1 Tax=Rickettsia endosymbiont of Nabis limbatus TaxID=3066268 RepID=UPI003AF3FEB8
MNNFKKLVSSVSEQEAKSLWKCVAGFKTIDEIEKNFTAIIYNKLLHSQILLSLSNKKGPVNCTKKGPLYVKIFMSNDLQIYSY